MEAHEQSLPSRRLKLCLNYVLELKSLPENPAYSSVFEPENIKWFEESESKIPLLDIRILPDSEKSKINLHLIDHAFFLDIAPWTLTVRFDLTKFKKDNQSGNTRFYLQLITEYPLSEFFLKQIHRRFENRGRSHCGGCLLTFTCGLPDDSSIYTAELQASRLALKRVYCSRERSFVILSDSLSSLQTIFNLKYDHPILVQILELYMTDQRLEEDCI